MSDAMSHETLGAGRTAGDWILGGLLVLCGLVLLGHAVVATTLSVLFVGWTTFFAGVVTLGFSLVRIGKQGFWTGFLGGGLMAALGLVMVRNPELTAVSLTLVAGAMFLSTGVARLAAAFQDEESRAALIFGGSISTMLGLLVLFNIFSASLALLGVLLGLQVLSEGIAIMVAGRGAVAAARLGSGRPVVS